ncbi:MAG: hypothetical protein Q4P29_01800 [Tissierellia bacterium]|nr:hypothetical protein [Tissierellia bacterium]
MDNQAKFDAKKVFELIIKSIEFALLFFIMACFTISFSKTKLSIIWIFLNVIIMANFLQDLENYKLKPYLIWLIFFAIVFLVGIFVFKFGYFNINTTLQRFYT